MFYRLSGALRWMASALAVAIVFTVFAPSATLAQTGPLQVGMSAVVANTDGDPILVRAAPGYDTLVLLQVTEGMVVEITEGPVQLADGSQWYGVMVEQTPGYIVSDYLVPAPSETAPVDSPVEPAVLTQPEAEAAGTMSVGGPGSTLTTSPLNLRSGPGTENSVLLVIPAGAAVSVTGEAQSGFLPVSYNGTGGWVAADYVSQDGGSTSSPAPSIGTGTTTVPVNFRSGPGTEYAAITVIPAGATVSLSGESSAGFIAVSYNGISGWVSADYVSTGAEPDPEPQPEPDPAPPTATMMVATANLNLRASSSLSAPVLTVIPQGTSVSVTGSAQEGFLPVTYGGQNGWASADFLSTSGNPGGDPGSNPGTTPPPSGGSGIAWPVSGGTWSIIQGYNGGTHQNRSSTAQYYYALDIARTDGNTAGQAVYAPASGTILWLDPGSGGIAIDMGNGYTIAMFHSTFDGSLSRGQTVSQGQYLGTISGPGGAGYASTPHVDITLWYTADGGRSASPFSGANSISGMSFPDVGGANQHGGTSFTP